MAYPRGVCVRTLLRFSGLLFGLALVPPVAVALREAVPSHTRNPLVRGVCRLLELGLDVLVVSALSLAMSLILVSKHAAGLSQQQQPPHGIDAWPACLPTLLRAVGAARLPSSRCQPTTCCCRTS